MPKFVKIDILGKGRGAGEEKMHAGLEATIPQRAGDCEYLVHEDTRCSESR